MSSITEVCPSCGLVILFIICVQIKLIFFSFFFYHYSATDKKYKLQFFCSLLIKILEVSLYPEMQKCTSLIDLAPQRSPG